MIEKPKNSALPFILLLMLLGFAAYLPAILHGGFIWDDDLWLTGSPIGSLGDLAAFWSFPDRPIQYYPMVHTTYFLEQSLWGFSPLGYHLVNVLLHLATCLLLWRVLARLAVPGARLAALLFAVHPIAVESVAWVAERKNVLSGFFYMAAFLVLLHFFSVRGGDRAGEDDSFGDRGGGRGFYHKAAFYLGGLLLFVLALLSKTVTSTLPAAVLVALWYARGRLRIRDFLWMLPFFALSAFFAAITAWTEVHLVGAQGDVFHFSFADRLVLAGRIAWFYPAKLFWPAGFSFNYARWTVDAGVWWQWLYPAAAALLIGFLSFGRKRLGRGPLAAVLFYGGTLFPALGFFNVYPFRYSFVADHFAYLAVTGLFALAGGLAASGYRLLYGGYRKAAVLALAVVVAFLCVQTARLSSVYQDNETLFRHVVSVNPGSFLAHRHLARIEAKKGNISESLAHFQAALDIRPGDLDARRPEAYLENELGCALTDAGDLDRARDHLKKSMGIEPDYARALLNLGVLEARQDRFRDAFRYYFKAYSYDPGLFRLGENMAVTFERWKALETDLGDTKNIKARSMDREAVQKVQAGDFARAATLYRQALDLDPGYYRARMNLAGVLLAGGRAEEAADQYLEAVEIRPESALARAGLGQAYMAGGQLEKAEETFQKTMELNPYWPQVHELLATVFKKQGREREARGERMRAAKLKAIYSDAYARAGEGYFKSRKPERARELFQQSLSFEPENQKAWTGLVASLKAMGEQDKALAAARAAGQKNPALGKNLEALALR